MLLVFRLCLAFLEKTPSPWSYILVNSPSKTTPCVIDMSPCLAYVDKIIHVELLSCPAYLDMIELIFLVFFFFFTYSMYFANLGKIKKHSRKTSLMIFFSILRLRCKFKNILIKVFNYQVTSQNIHWNASCNQV